MSSVKSMKVPFIEGLEKMSYEGLDLALDEGAAKSIVNEINWPEQFPYCPDCVIAVAHSKTHLAVMYHVRGLDLRATALEDNGPCWEDSCCEFFVCDPSDGTYYNFEMNCIGTLLAAKRTSRTEKTLFGKPALSRVIRHTTLAHKERELNGKIFGWSIAMVIPFTLIGVDPQNLPKSLKANFYKCGDKTAHPHYLSWSPIGTTEPDFHRPDFFGELILG